MEKRFKIGNIFNRLPLIVRIGSVIKVRFASSSLPGMLKKMCRWIKDRGKVDHFYRLGQLMNDYIKIKKGGILL